MLVIYYLWQYKSAVKSAYKIIINNEFSILGADTPLKRFKAYLEKCPF